MKNNHSFLALTFLLILMLSCQSLTISTPVQITPSRQVQTTQTTSTLPPTAVASPANELIPSPIPPSSTALGSASDLTNTHWVGRIYDEDNKLIWEVFEIIFLPDGKLRYYVPNAWYEDGTWQQKGDDITLEWKNHFCDFYGILYEDTIAGARKCTHEKARGWWVQLKNP